MCTSQPKFPLTLTEIVQRRSPQLSAQPIPVFSSSISSSLLSTIGPPPKKVLTIVSWNIQTFFEAKAQANPYVNVIIKRILEVLDVDICLLLETREDVPVILNAVEHELANPTTFKPEETTEDDWDEQTLEQESIDHLKNLEARASLPTTFLALATELTGKRYKPPARVLLNGNPDTFFPKMLKSQSFTGENYNGQWKITYQASGTLKSYYELYRKSTDAPEFDIANVPLTQQDEADMEFRLKHCPSCGEHFGKSTDCKECDKYGPFSTDLENLRRELDTVAFSLAGKVQLETYGVFVRPHNLEIAGATIQMSGKRAEAISPGCQLLRHERRPPEWTLEQRLAEYKRSKGLPPNSLPPEVAQSVDQDLDALHINRADFALEAKLDRLGAPREGSELMSRDERMGRFAQAYGVTGDRGVALIDRVRSKGGGFVPDVDEQLTFVGVPKRKVRRMTLADRLQAFRRRFSVSFLAADQEVLERIDQELLNQAIDPNAVILEAAFNRINVPKGPPAKLLPYLDPSSSTYGRSPFVLPLKVILAGEAEETEIPLVGFHAPYGDDNLKGLQIRVDSLKQVLNADVGDGLAFVDHDSAILMGDLNLDLNASVTQQGGSKAKEAYEGLGRAGFHFAIPAVPSSLASVFNNNWKKQHLPTKYDGAPFCSKSGPVTAFTSSAYDNVLVKGAKLPSKVITAAVIDVIGWIKQELGKSISEDAALLEWPGFAGLNPDQKAFFIYRAFVSDHLPIVLDIAVDPLPRDYDQKLQDLLFKQRMESPRLKILELTYSACRWIDSCPASAPSPLISSDRSIAGIGLVSAFDRQMGFTLQDATGSTDFGPPIQCLGSPAPGQHAAVVMMKEAPHSAAHVWAIVDCATPAEYFVSIDPELRSALLIGRVTKISRDGLRFRIAVGLQCCVLNRPDNWPNPPVVGSYIIAILERVVQKEVWVVPK